MNAKLTLTEESDLLKLKDRVKGGLSQAIEALGQIHARKLYRKESRTFEEFCNKNWGWSASYVKRLLSAKEVIKSVPIGTISNEGQARALARVPVTIRYEVVAEARKSGSLTAKAITKAAQEIDRPRITAGLEPVFDKVGIKVTSNAMKYWDRGSEVEEMMSDLSRIKCAIDKAQKSDDKMFVEVSNSTLADLMMCRQSISHALPYTVCSTCNGQIVDKCTLCRGRGVISKELYMTVPIEFRNMREKTAKKGAK